MERQPTDPTAASGTWRDVTLRQYRVYTQVSTIVGTLVFGAGLVFLVTQRVFLGLLLIAAGSFVGLWTVSLRIEGTPAALYAKREGRGELWTPRVVHFYTRQNCSLCHEARARLEHDLGQSGITIVDHDVDRDAALRRRYGDRVPVAVHEGGEVFVLEYDPDAVRAIARK